MTKEDIKKKLVNDPEWEPSDADIKKDPDIWVKVDQVMEEMHGSLDDIILDDETPKPRKKKGDDFDDIFNINSQSLVDSPSDIDDSELDLY